MVPKPLSGSTGQVSGRRGKGVDALLGRRHTEILPELLFTARLETQKRMRSMAASTAMKKPAGVRSGGYEP